MRAGPRSATSPEDETAMGEATARRTPVQIADLDAAAEQSAARH